MNNHTDYDKLHFSSQPSPQRHPDRIATVAKLYGYATPSFSKSLKILEIGCSTGTNIIPIAESYPKSFCLGIDLSKPQIDKGNQTLDSLDIKNCELKVCDIGALDSSYGSFDYILCHGVFSWVKSETRRSILKTIQNLLSDNGLALVSFLGKSAWYIPSLIHEQAQEIAKLDLSIEEKVRHIRNICDSLLAKQVDDYSPYGMLLRSKLKTIKTQSDSLIFHELLNPHSSPYSISEFISILKNYDLNYISDANFFNRFLGPQLEELNLEFEDLSPEVSDIITPFKLHSAVICKNSNAKTKNSIAKTLCELFISSPHVLDETPSNNQSSIFITPSGSEFRCSSEIGARVLSSLSNNWPEPLLTQSLIKSLSGFSLTRKAIVKHEVLLEIAKLILDGIITPHASNLSINGGELKKPKLNNYTQYELQHQTWATNKRHEYNTFQKVERQIALLFDGSRTEKQVVNIVSSWFVEGKLQIPKELKEQSQISHKDIAESLVSDTLEKLSSCAFL